MIYTTNNQTFELIADALDAHYLTLNNYGYDLCALEGIHLIDGSITLLFDEDYGTPIHAYFKQDDNWLANAVAAVIRTVTK